MAKAIDYQPEPAKIGPDAHEELARLLESLHQHGVLRLANDLVGANQDIAQVLVKGLQREGTLNAMQNISVLLLALSSIPPEKMYKLAFGLRDMADALSQPAGAGEHNAPGLQGAWKMLQDEDLWHALQPLLGGMKAFARRMEEPVDKPIAAWTGKPSDA
ncbi:DUF1641 domain-containing protein [Kosakonia sp. YIM B13611]|uniref:DUF1641 domain-containing protein n=1 Tax=unclassified Kosakonia TaxID=2632876 RepID=UPI0036BF8A39